MEEWAISSQFSGIVSFQELTIQGLPDSDEQHDPQVQNRLCPTLHPPHPRKLQPLANDRLAGGLRHAAADWQVQAFVLMILHELRAAADVLVRLAKLGCPRRRQLPPL